MEIYNECIKFEKIIYDNPILNVDATYIVHLENNGRIDNIKKQLDEYNISGIVYIVYDKGYRKCKKEDYITTPMYDIVDTNFKIFADADKKNYKNILILEDDFIFSPAIKDNLVSIRINSFIKDKEDENFQYSLGLVTWLLIPYDNYHYTTINGCVTGGTHGIIFSKECRNTILKVNKEEIKDWDIFCSKISKRYIYYIPLCYQKFYETENSNYWHENKMIIQIIKMYNRILKLDTEPEFGFHLMYVVAKILPPIICLIILYIIINLSKSIKNRIN